MRRPQVSIFLLFSLPLSMTLMPSLAFASAGTQVHVSALILPSPEQRMAVGELLFTRLDDRAVPASPAASAVMYEGTGDLVVRSGTRWSLSVTDGSAPGVDVSARLSNGGEWQSLAGESVVLAAGPSGSVQLEWDMKVHIPPGFNPAPGQRAVSVGVYMMSE